MSYSILNKIMNIHYDYNSELTIEMTNHMKNVHTLKFISLFTDDNENMILNKFNQSIDNLPSNIESLFLGYEFNQPINNLPNGLRCLYITGLFNQNVDFLPNTLEVLEIMSIFDKPIDNLPDSIEILVLPISYDNDILSLPRNLRKLTLPYNYQFLNKKIPKTKASICFVNMCRYIW